MELDFGNGICVLGQKGNKCQVEGIVDAKAGKSGEVWHVRRREYVPPNGAVKVSTERGAIAESPQESTDFIPGAMGSQSKALEPQRPLSLLMLPEVGCC